MMDNCRICFKFKSVGNDRVCERCRIKEERKTATKIRLVYHKAKIRPENTANGRILSKEDWFYIKRRIDDFYASISSDDIDWMNKENERTRDENHRVVSGFVYLMKADNGYYKIGRARDVSIRNKDHMRDYPLVITVLHSFFCRNYVKGEAFLLNMFSDKRLQGEWFELEAPDIKFIKDITDEIATKLF